MPTAFLSLPLELRTQIYEYVLLLPDSKTWISGSALSPTSPTSPTSPKSPTLTFAFPTPYLDGLIPVNLPEFSTGPAALLRACSIINQEASQVLYSRNCFKVKAAQALLEWLEAIGPQNTQHLKALHIIAGARYFKSWPKVLCTLRDQAPGLRHIFISWRHHEQYGEDCIRDALAEIRGLEKLTIDTSVLENCSLRMVKRSQIYLEKAMGMPVSLGPIASEMATAVTSCCCELKCTQAPWLLTHPAYSQAVSPVQCLRRF